MNIFTIILIAFAALAMAFNVSMTKSWIHHFIISRGHDHYHFDYTGGAYRLGEQQLVLMEIGTFVIAAIATLLAVLSIYMHYILVVNFAITTMFALGNARGIRHQRLYPITHRFHL